MSESGVRLPNEDDTYREARQALLDAERGLRLEIERVAAMRRALPAGGALPTDYRFDAVDRDSGAPTQVALSDLFERPDASLVLYSFMYAEGARPCPMCTSFLDAFDRVVPHVSQRLNVAVVARGSIGQVTNWAARRGWTNLRMLSSANNSYHADYLSEAPDGAQIPMINVFRRNRGTIRHCYSTEMFFAPNEPGMHPRHVDSIFPMWNVFDLTPEGRPADWFPQLAYDGA